MASRRKVFFPWEQRRGPFGLLARMRVHYFVGLALVVVFIGWARAREEHAAGVRATRASIAQAMQAVVSFRADHAGACPKALAELVSGGYVREAPIDAWGQSLRLVCPGRRDPSWFELSSDGPDGLPWGVDRVE